MIQALRKDRKTLKQTLGKRLSSPESSSDQHLSSSLPCLHFPLSLCLHFIVGPFKKTPVRRQWAAPEMRSPCSVLFCFVLFFFPANSHFLLFPLQLFASYCYGEGSSMSCSPYRDALEWYMPQGGPCPVVGHSQPCPFEVSLLQYGSPIVTVSPECACSSYDGLASLRGNLPLVSSASF